MDSSQIEMLQPGKNRYPEGASQAGEAPSASHSSSTKFLIPRKPLSAASKSIFAVDDGQGHYQHVGSREIKNTNSPIVRTSFWKTWWLEIICCFLYVSALIAIVATIKAHEERPLPRWPYKLSINTLISVYMVILKATMLLVAAAGLDQLKWRWFEQERPLKDLLAYDNASRGPWGSLVLLWRLRGQQLISSCGAFVTIAALIMDPFAQQVVNIYECRLLAEEGIARIPRSNSFDEYTAYTNTTISNILLPFQNAINDGIFNPGRAIDFDCSTGNCTFPEEYSTVGYCSQCNDITNKLSIALETNKLNITTFNFTLNSQQDFPSTSLAANSLEWDNPFLVMKGGAITEIISTRLLGKKSSSCPDTCSSLNADTINKCNENSDLLQFGCTSLPLELTPAVGAAMCTLKPCVRTYSASVDAGRLVEKLAATSDHWGQGTQGGDFPSQVDIGCLNNKEKALLQASGYDLVDKSWLPFNASLDYTASDQDIAVNDGTISAKCVYQIGSMMTIIIGHFLSGFLNGTIEAGFYTGDYQGPMAVQAIYQEGNTTFKRIDDVWRNMSDAITGYMRQNGEANLNEPVIGKTWQVQVCVSVRWLFLIYPAALVLLATVFFAFMLFQTRRSEVSRHDWKSSPLALMFHGLDLQSINYAGLSSVTEAKEMERIADQIPVRLTQNDSGWQFSGTKSKPVGC